MNERPKLGSEPGGLNVHLWVLAAAKPPVGLGPHHKVRLPRVAFKQATRGA